MPDAMESDDVGGIAAHVVAGFGNFTLIGEYVAGLDDAIEVSTVEIVSVAFQGTKNLGGVLPETRLVTSVGFGLTEALSLAFQYDHDQHQ